MLLRKTQQEILKYSGGRLAISAVPGSGKTFILSLLATKLLSEGFIDINAGQQVLIVTYMNSSVETFRASIRKFLDQARVEPLGFEVRTLHSLALEIVQNAIGGADGKLDNMLITDEAESINFISLSVSTWISENFELWERLLPDDSPQESVRWRGIFEKISKVFIREAKNYQHSPEKILSKLRTEKSEAAQPLRSLSQLAEERELYQVRDIPLLGILSEIYELYQSALTRQSAMDFDDLIWSASDILQAHHGAAEVLRNRWPYVLEDEAQDSVPLQERLLETITGKNGNWVRVGDPNQAIMSTFTASHPKLFNSFLDQEDVMTLPLPHSGRNAPVIFGAANNLVNWVCDSHPIPEVRANAFRRQMILPTPEGDSQPNPTDDESSVKISVYKQREDEELPKIADLAIGYSSDYPDHTLAILTPTNDLGFQMTRILDQKGVDYDQQLRSDNEIKEIAASLSAVLTLLADPLDKKALAATYAALTNLEHPALPSNQVNTELIHRILLSVHMPESFLFAGDVGELTKALPRNVASDEELQYLAAFADYLRKLFELRPLAFDDLILALSDELFSVQYEDKDRSQEMDLAIAYHLSGAARSWLDIHPDWRLPEISAQLTNVARGSHTLPFKMSDETGYKPTPGRITLATQHRAKGGEWDAVFLIGIDGGWIPGDLDAPFFGIRMPSGNDPSAEAIAQLRLLMDGSSGLYPGRSATETGHIETICERLRLLYVGITRARRYLHVSRSRSTRHFDKVVDSEPATALGVLYRFILDHSSGSTAA